MQFGEGRKKSGDLLLVRPPQGMRHQVSHP
jgi:hypothetical protein